MLVQVTRKLACHERPQDPNTYTEKCGGLDPSDCEEINSCAELFHCFDYISLVLQKSKKVYMHFLPL